MLVAYVLKKLTAKHPDLEIEQIEVITCPNKARKAGVRLIPTLKINNDKLSGIILTPTMVREFILKHLFAR